jgi:hypothetical protein
MMLDRSGTWLWALQIRLIPVPKNTPSRFPRFELIKVQPDADAGQVDQSVLEQLPEDIVEELHATLQPSRKKSSTSLRYPLFESNRNNAVANAKASLAPTDAASKPLRQLSMENFSRLWQLRANTRGVTFQSLSQPVSAEVVQQLPLLVQLSLVGDKSARGRSEYHRKCQAIAPPPATFMSAKRPATNVAMKQHAPSTNLDPTEQHFRVEELYTREPMEHITQALFEWLKNEPIQLEHVCLCLSFTVHCICTLQLDICVQFLR